MQIVGHLRTVILACLAALSSAPVHAEDAILAVTMAGEAYDGAPQFRLMADKQVVGSGEIAKALDTAKGEHLKLPDGAKPAEAERFVFAVPNIQDVSQFEIEFVNDAWAGKDKPGDRNLYVLGLTLSIVKTTATGPVAETRDFAPSQLEAVTLTPGGAGITPHYAALFQEGRLLLKRPANGWTVATAPQEPSQASPPQPDPAAALPCRRMQLELKGFERNTTALSPAMLEQLRQMAKALHGTSCSARVTAYARGGPSDTFRTKLSLDRAKAVAHELAKLGLARERIKTESALGGGRRVVISFE